MNQPLSAIVAANATAAAEDSRCAFTTRSIRSIGPCRSPSLRAAAPLGFHCFGRHGLRFVIQRSGRRLASVSVGCAVMSTGRCRSSARRRRTWCASSTRCCSSCAAVGCTAGPSCALQERVTPAIVTAALVSAERLLPGSPAYQMGICSRDDGVWGSNVRALLRWGMAIRWILDLPPNPRASLVYASASSTVGNASTRMNMFK